jgi:hypothetical protein
MNTKMNLFLLTMSFVLISFIGLSWAAVEGEEITMNPMKKHKAASGSAIISSDSLSIEARGLKPNSVYTVWFVNKKPKKKQAGAGTPPYMFKTNDTGEGRYSAPLSESPFKKWQMIMIVLHPNGDPEDMKRLVGALKANL